MCAATLEHPAIRLARRLGREPRADEAEHVLRRTGSHGAARFELARLLQAQRRYGEAEREWRTLTATAPGDLGAWQGHVRVLRLLHRFGDAEAVLAGGRQRFGDVRGVVLEAARLAMQREEHAAATALYHRALAMPGSAAEPLDELAKVLTAQHRFAAARAILTRLAETEPTKPARWEALARLAEEEGDLERAWHGWEQVRDRDHAGLRAKLAFGRLHEELGRPVAAERLYRDLVERHPTAAAPLYQLGRLALSQSDPSTALAWHERAAALEPGEWAIQAAIVRATAEQQRFAAARRLAGMHVARLPDFLDARLLLAWVEEHSGRERAADRCLTEAVDAFPQSYQLAVRHAEVLVRRGKLGAARTKLEEAAARHPSTLSVRLALADACFALGDTVAAASQVSGLADDYPQHREVAKRLARVEVAMGRYGTARALWAELSRFDRRVAGPPVNLERIDRRPIPPADGEIRLFTRQRNELLRLPWLLDFYRGQGVDRFFVVDNGSDDGSRDFLLAQPDVHLFLTADSYAVYGGGM
ncbi:MAG: tetratricopeptide repeat protein, partial [Geminicoccaceae bacterium]